MHLEAVRLQSRATQRQPVVASIATAASFPCHCIAQSVSRSRDGSKRLSRSSPESGSSTAAWNTAL
jgi:hypothetical protein